MPPIISLITDFGLVDPFVGLVKATILAHCREARVVDLTHAVPPWDIEAGAFWLRRCYPHFPAGSVHVAVVDPGVGTSRGLLAVSHAGHRFLAPDNGLLADIAAEPGAEARRIAPALLASLGADAASPTFHGRDLFAPLAARLGSGVLDFADLGRPTQDWVHGDWPKPRRTPEGLTGRVLHVDIFGNIFSNIDVSLINECQDWEALLAGRVLPRVRTYGEGVSGELVSLVNSFGVVEAACVQGHAAKQLSVVPGEPFELRWR